MFHGLILRLTNIMLALIVKDNDRCNPIYLGIVVPGIHYCSDCSVQLVSSSKQSSSFDFVLTVEATCRKEESSHNSILVRSESEPVGWSDVLAQGMSVVDPFWTTLAMDIYGRSVTLDYEVHVFTGSKNERTDPLLYGVRESRLEINDAVVACGYNKNGIVRCGSDLCFDPMQLDEMSGCTDVDFLNGPTKAELLR